MVPHIFGPGANMPVNASTFPISTFSLGAVNADLGPTTMKSPNTNTETNEIINPFFFITFTS